MDEIFTSTHWRGSTRNMLINNERILYIERTENETVAYTVTFDNGQTLTLDEGTGKAFYEQLGKLARPQPSVQYIGPPSVNRRPDYIRPPNNHRRRAIS